MSSLAVSQIQQHFIKKQIYKRSRRYFDVLKLKSIEQSHSKSRRKPDYLHHQIQKRYQNAFISSQNTLNKKRFVQIQKFKKKRSQTSIITEEQSSKNHKFTFDHSLTDTQTNCSYNTTNNKQKTFINNCKGLDMNKTLPRQFYENLTQNRNIVGSFDRYIISDFDHSNRIKAIDFSKVKGRDHSISSIKKALYFNSKNNLNQENFEQIINPENIQSQTQRNNITITDVNKIYQKICFDQSTFRCLLDIQNSKKISNIKLESIKTTQPRQIQLQKIQKGRNFTTKNLNKSNLMFYYGKGKQQPSQIHYKLLKNNQNYWIEQLKRMKKQQFQTVKRRQQMIDKKIKLYKIKKQVIDERGELCDTKYFLRKKEKQKIKKKF